MILRLYRLSNTFVNVETGHSIGKHALDYSEVYWYYNIKSELIRKDNEDKKYYL